MQMRHRQLAAAGLAAAALATVATPLALAAPVGAGAAQCAKFSGTVLLTYSNPQTIILHVIKGKVNAATTFTMTPTTTFLRNGAPATFADVRIGDAGTITAQAQQPSGTLLACSVAVSGP
jgi:hypothetical protein